VQAAWETLRSRYGEGHRHYHDLGHLAHCLEQLDLARDALDRPDAVEMAIWFHDIINEPDSRANEQLSAEYFRSKAQECMAPDFVQHVAELILVATHAQARGNNDQRFICDIDLASFGCPWECFMRDSDAVKAEFSGSEEAYYRGKSAFLRRCSLDRASFKPNSATPGMNNRASRTSSDCCNSSKRARTERRPGRIAR